MNPNPSETMRTLSTTELGRQCIASLRELQKVHAATSARLLEIQAEAEKLITIATFAGADVPDDLRELAATKRSPKSPVKCPKCGMMSVSAAGLRIHDARSHPTSRPAV